MKKCWANSLGNCSKKISSEHLISKGIFNGREFSVRGFPWCKDEFVTVGINSITRKCLCEKHNNDLSVVDDEGIKFFNTLDEIASLTIPDNKSTKRININIDGYLIERWFLKTLINLSYKSYLQIGKLGELPGWPHIDLVHVVYGITNFTDYLGLYTLVLDGDKSPSYGNIEVSPFVNKEGFIGGGIFYFRGINFFLSLHPAPPPKKFSDIDAKGFSEKIGNSSFLYRCPKMEWSKAGKTHHTINMIYNN
jgi:hypothetical protein